MNTSETPTMNPEERAVYTAMTERMRQLRRRSGIPNGVSMADAVALHMISPGEVEHARWGDIVPQQPELPVLPSTA
jgi:hypothetical protein